MITDLLFSFEKRFTLGSLLYLFLNQILIAFSYFQNYYKRTKMAVFIHFIRFITRKVQFRNAKLMFWQYRCDHHCWNYCRYKENVSTFFFLVTFPVYLMSVTCVVCLLSKLSMLPLHSYWIKTSITWKLYIEKHFVVLPSVAYSKLQKAWCSNKCFRAGALFFCFTPHIIFIENKKTHGFLT